MTNEWVVSAEDAIEALRGVVGGKEGFVYEPPDTEEGTCVYVHQNQPSCGVGQALYRLGARVEELIKLDPLVERDGYGFPRFIRDTTPASQLMHVDFLPFRVSPEATQVFIAFQEAQDEQIPWGQSLEYAEEVVREIELEEAAEGA